MSKLVQKFNENGFVRRFRNDCEFRLTTTVLFGSCCTTAIGLYDLVLAVSDGTESAIWLFTLAIYLLTLAVVRIVALVAHRYGVKRYNSERQRLQSVNIYLGGGAMIVLLTLAYSGIIVLVTANGFHYTYRGNMIFLMAAYAFYKIISAIVNAVKNRRLHDLARQTFRNVNLVDGMVSIVALQSAMLFSFDDDLAFSNIMNAAVGGVAGALMLALGTYMIVRGARLRSIVYSEVQHE